ncbi:MAG: DUF2167 domain-containing protein [Verrucomicrobiota bacterium]
MKITTRTLLFGTALLLALASPLHSQEAQLRPENDTALKAHNDFMQSLSWKTEGKGSLGSRAEIAIPEGYRFLGAGDSSKLMKYYGNLSDGSELGFLSPNEMEWFAVFEFDDVGYVKDDEKDKLDADEILKQLQEGQKLANEELTRQGHPTLNVLGWHTPPNYNPETKNLEWAIRLSSSDGGQVLNYNTKLLGRRGVMEVVLVCSEEQLPTVIPHYQSMLKGFSYKKEESYAAFTKGDKIAEYGLVGLIAGGGLLVAAKAGWLAKFGKFIVIGLVAIGAFFKRLISGKKPESI